MHILCWVWCVIITLPRRRQAVARRCSSMTTGTCPIRSMVHTALRPGGVQHGTAWTKSLCRSSPRMMHRQWNARCFQSIQAWLKKKKNMQPRTAAELSVCAGLDCAACSPDADRLRPCGVSALQQTARTVPLLQDGWERQREPNRLLTHAKTDLSMLDSAYRRDSARGCVYSAGWGSSNSYILPEYPVPVLPLSCACAPLYTRAHTHKHTQARMHTQTEREKNYNYLLLW